MTPPCFVKSTTVSLPFEEQIINENHRTMTRKDTETLYADMLEQLETINGSVRGHIQNLTESLYCTVSALNRLRELVRAHKFPNDDAEIDFFKYQKPHIHCWHIYVIELHHILVGVPVGTDKEIRDYYTDELGIINRFFRRYPFQYQYYLADENAMDEDFFLCRSKEAFPPGQEDQHHENSFSTNLDFLLAKFRAYEMLRDAIIRRVRLLYQQTDSAFISEMMVTKRRWWSGDKVELIEIAYGIYYTHRINGGRAEVGDIVEWLEESLNVDLGQAYRMFLDIRRRKTVSYTKFLDEMREAIHKQIDETNSYRKSKKQGLSL